MQAEPLTEIEMKFPWTLAGQLLLILVRPSNTSPLLHTLPKFHPQPNLLALVISLSLAASSSFLHRQGILSESGDNHLQWVSFFPSKDKHCQAIAQLQ